MSKGRALFALVALVFTCISLLSPVAARAGECEDYCWSIFGGEINQCYYVWVGCLNQRGWEDWDWYCWNQDLQCQQNAYSFLDYCLNSCQP